MLAPYRGSGTSVSEQNNWIALDFWPLFLPMPPPGSFQLAHRAVRVHAHDQLGPEAAAVFQQRDVTDVQQVEAAVGKDDALARCAPLAHA